MQKGPSAREQRSAALDLPPLFGEMSGQTATTPAKTASAEPSRLFSAKFKSQRGRHSAKLPRLMLTNPRLQTAGQTARQKLLEVLRD
jgi:hypothetical protein